MSLSEKIGQMTQVSNDSLTPSDVAEFHIGSVLSGGDGNPSPNTPGAWRDLVRGFAEAAAGTKLAIPLLYGVDAVHGNSNVRGATIFPHNIGLGAAGDSELVRRIGEATALEMAATGINWTFAPAVSVAEDIRWGRTFESFGRDTHHVATLAAALVSGLSGDSNTGVRVLSCPKHFLGDGSTTWGSVDRKPWMQWWDGWGESWMMDQGDSTLPYEDLITRHLPPFRSAIDAGALSVMASYSSWKGDKLHGHVELLTGLLKGEQGFSGFVVSDWMGVDQLSPDYSEAVTMSINAGVDMVMVPFEFRRFIAIMHDAVADGSISMDRIDDAVTRILGAKLWVADWRRDPDELPLSTVGADRHRELAAEAARRSAVLLSGATVLPISTSDPILVGGQAADDIGLQCGGWTVGWQGSAGATTPGTTLWEALRKVPNLDAVYEPTGDTGTSERYRIGIVCVAEDPYAEGPGDCAVPSLRPGDVEVFQRMRERCDVLVSIVYSGRPLVIPEVVADSDAVVAAWLPGSEATELPSLLFGSAQFEGTLPQPWPTSAEQLSRQVGPADRTTTDSAP